MGRWNVKKSNAVAGFTLVELMITVVILLILLLVAVPSFQDYIQKARVRGAADQVTNLLAKARQAAVMSNMPVSVLAVGSADEWCLGARQPAEPGPWALRPSTAATCACDSAPSTCVVESEQLVVASSALASGSPPSVAVTGFNFSYTPKLGAVSLNGAPGKAFMSPAQSSLRISSPNNRYSVDLVVTPLGQSYVCIPAGKPPFFGYRPC
jgi:type IV fimbrial biogenesis protein FimT